jgi:heptosyltransferase-2
VKTQLNVELHYLTREQYLPVISSSPYIDKIFTFRHSIREVIPDLRNESYHAIIDLQKNRRSFGLRLSLKKPFYTFPKINFRKWLAVNLKINKLPEIHLADRYFIAVRDLNVLNDGKGLNYFISEKDKVEIHLLPELFQQGYYGWVIGGKHNTKIFPEERIIAVCKALKAPVILIGGKEDKPKGDRIREAVGEFIFNACGVFSLGQSASLVQQSKKIITNDTGMMHIAAAFRKEIISLWGNTIPGFGMSPYMPGDEAKSHIFEAGHIPCRPCSKLGYKKCPMGHFDCMNKIDADKILKALMNQ